MEALILFLPLFFLIPTSAQNLTSMQTDCTHIRSDSARPEPQKLNEIKIGKNIVCAPRSQNSAPLQPVLKLGEQPADHSVVPKIDCPPPVSVKTAFIDAKS
jgi:hypothetical protein